MSTQTAPYQLKSLDQAISLLLRAQTILGDRTRETAGPYPRQLYFPATQIDERTLLDDSEQTRQVADTPTRSATEEATPPKQAPLPLQE